MPVHSQCNVWYIHAGQKWQWVTWSIVYFPCFCLIKTVCQSPGPHQGLVWKACLRPHCQGVLCEQTFTIWKRARFEDHSFNRQVFKWKEMLKLFSGRDSLTCEQSVLFLSVVRILIWAGRLGVESRWRPDSHLSKQALGLTQPPVHGYWVSFPGVKMPERGVDHPPPCSAEVNERVEFCYSFVIIPVGPSWSV
jgi:hypothetical protein